MNDTDLLMTLDAAPYAGPPYAVAPDPARLRAILETPVPLRRHRGRLRVAVAAAVAALAGTGVWLSSPLSPTALALESWTPVPTSLSAADRLVGDRACRAKGLDASDATVELAERRGDWTVLLYAGSRGSEPVWVGCLARVVGGHADDVEVALSGGVPVPPPVDGITSGGLMQLAGQVTVVDGYVGADVSRVVVTTADGRRVTATVADGHYVAWWPGRALDASYAAS